MKTRVIIHRIISWWLALFSILTILSGYATARRWFDNIEMVTILHIITKWTFFILMLYHVIYTFIFVNLKGIVFRHPKKHWIRLIQQITKWLILGFSILIMITGFGHYSWGLPNWVLERIHLTSDIGLTVSIIVHLLSGFKLMLNRKKVKSIIVDYAILSIGIALIAIVIVLDLL